jgi:tetratricopeptide (TPR) repeat protein
VAQIGRGGQGTVFRARHGELRTTVALKVLQDGRPEPVARFQEEARILARLHHTHLLRVSDLGEVDGIPYLAMDFVEGRDLAAIVREDGVPEAAWSSTLLAQVARVVSYCHDNGLVHRDLKPANILLEDGGRPILVDFGLVKRDPQRLGLSVADERVASVEGQVLGTPAYMAPEQVDPSFGEIGPATDVYGLGATLYFLLTGQAPFKGGSVYNVLHAVMHKAPVSPRQLNGDVPRWLSELCLTALAKSPDQRPASPTDLAAALQAGDPRRRHAVRWAATTLLGVLLGLGVGAVMQQLTEPLIRWPAAVRVVSAGGLLSEAELGSLASQAGEAPADWQPLLGHLAAQCALRAGAERAEAQVAALPQGPARDLLLAEVAQARGDLPRAYELLTTGAVADLPWRRDAPARRWEELTTQLRLAQLDELAASACLQVARQLRREGAAPDHVVDWVEQGFEHDGYRAAHAGEPLADFLLADARRRLAIEPAEPAPVARARVQLFFFRLIRPTRALPDAVLERLWQLGTGPNPALRRAALPGISLCDPYQWAALKRLLERPPSEAERRAAEDGQHPLAAAVGHQHSLDRMVSRYSAKCRDWLLWRPDVAGIWMRLADAEDRLQRYDLVYRAYEVVLPDAHSSVRSTVQRSLGRIAAERGDLVTATEHLRAGLQVARAGGLDPWWPSRDLARVLLLDGRPAEVLEVLEGVAVQGLAPEHAATYWLQRADALQALGREEEARASKDRALAAGFR